VTAELGQRYEIRFQPAARRAIAQRLPEGVAAAVLKFCEAALAVSPHRDGKSLFGPLAGCHSARRGTYRIIYRVKENGRIVHVLDIDQRFSTDMPVYPQALLYHA
jgi:mRNA interferase RelE/StbE